MSKTAKSMVMRPLFKMKMREDNWQWYERRKKAISEIAFQTNVDILVPDCRHTLLSKLIPDFLKHFDVKQCFDNQIVFVTSDKDGQYILNWSFRTEVGGCIRGHTETGVYIEDIPAERNGAEYIIRGALDDSTE